MSKQEATEERASLRLIFLREKKKRDYSFVRRKKKKTGGRLKKELQFFTAYSRVVNQVR